MNLSVRSHRLNLSVRSHRLNLSVRSHRLNLSLRSHRLNLSVRSHRLNLSVRSHRLNLSLRSHRLNLSLRSLLMLSLSWFRSEFSLTLIQYLLERAEEILFLHRSLTSLYRIFCYRPSCTRQELQPLQIPLSRPCHLQEGNNPIRLKAFRKSAYRYGISPLLLPQKLYFLRTVFLGISAPFQMLCNPFSFFFFLLMIFVYFQALNARTSFL